MPTIANGRFLILGAASQIGVHIARQLLAAGAQEVRLLDNLSSGSLEPMKDVLADTRARLLRADMLRLNEVLDACRGMDGVFSVAGIMATQFGENPWNGVDVNIRGLQNALEACRQLGVRKIVISSSVGVYGTSQADALSEDAPLSWAMAPSPMTLYCASKVMAEALARLYREQHGLDFVALRYSAVYGEHQHGRALVGKRIADACASLGRGEPIVVQGDGSQVQDYLHAADAARANLLAMESPVSGESLNICAGEDTSEARIMELVAAACGSTLRPVFQGDAGSTRQPPRRQIGYTRDKARRLIGWEPQIDIAEGIRRVQRWVAQRG
ncbi:MAG: NAD-dependent epimerase/dehydratase family protein [Rhodoferax sp.]|nr:NAD-dependent epimerase/dehydratase family protein [Rhodoferax sp.]